MLGLMHFEDLQIVRFLAVSQVLEESQDLKSQDPEASQDLEAGQDQFGLGQNQALQVVDCCEVWRDRMVILAVYIGDLIKADNC